MSTPSVIVLPGDGIGPEVTAAAVRVLETLGIAVDERLFGGAAIDAMGDPLPAGTLEACRVSDAVLLGAVGGPKWDGGDVRPEAGLMGLRKALDVFANLRPAVQGDVDLLIVRELVGGLYFGARGVRDDGTVFDTLEYRPDQVERVARRAFDLARGRSSRLLSVDKSNVLDTSRMWRRVVSEVAADYPEVELAHGLVDSVAMQIVTDPGTFDVLVMENMFGDVREDVAERVLRQDDVELLRVGDELHRRAVDEGVTELDVRVVGSDFGDDAPPEPRGVEHVRLVDGADLAAPRAPK